VYFAGDEERRLYDYLVQRGGVEIPAGQTYLEINPENSKKGPPLPYASGSLNTRVGPSKEEKTP
jgi:hypothetical protein